MTARKKAVLISIGMMIFLVGMVIVIYPMFSEYWNSLHNSTVFTDYDNNVAKMNKDQYEEIWNSAIEYNHKLSMSAGLKWPISDEEQSEYDNQLNIDGSGNMGFVTIPKIGVNLAIYHGTGEDALQNAVGHLMGTSLPVGNVISEDMIDQEPLGSHCVISGHRGLPTARLFSDLDQMEIGDKFYLTVLDKVLTYEIDQITIILPDDLTDITMTPNTDYCTLVTCTPYGINSHRLLVRGHRVKNAKEKVVLHYSSDAGEIDSGYIVPMLGAVALFLLLIVIIVIPKKQNKEET